MTTNDLTDAMIYDLLAGGVISNKDAMEALAEPHVATCELSREAMALELVVTGVRGETRAPRAELRPAALARITKYLAEWAPRDGERTCPMSAADYPLMYPLRFLDAENAIREVFGRSSVRIVDGKAHLVVP